MRKIGILLSSSHKRACFSRESIFNKKKRRACILSAPQFVYRTYLLISISSLSMVSLICFMKSLYSSIVFLCSIHLQILSMIAQSMINSTTINIINLIVSISFSFLLLIYRFTHKLVNTTANIFSHSIRFVYIRF